jgi:tetratricopeptide (TPR) repeat protein
MKIFNGSRGCKSWLVWALFLISQTGVKAHGQMNAARVFSIVEPSVVLIQSTDMSGSGVLISNDGTVLTNLHVAGTPLPLKITAQVRVGMKMEPRTFDRVELVSVHPDDDLALVRIKTPAGTQFVPIRGAGATRLATGEACFAIGTPGVASVALNNTITQGIVSAADRIIEGKSYIQFDASINPGNSGGPLCNSAGAMVGIVTFKVANAQGLGFAIPASRIDLRKFVRLDQRPNNLAEARRLQSLGNDCLAAAQSNTGAERERLVGMAIAFHRNAFLEAQNDPDICYNIARVYGDLGRADVAKAFAEAGLKINPNHAWNQAFLGILISLEDPQKALRLWWACLKNGTNAAAASVAATEIAEAHLQRRTSFFESGYLLQWADALAAAPTEEARMHRKNLLEEVWPHLSNEEYQFLRNKKTPYSEADLLAFSNRNSRKPPTGQPLSKPSPSPVPAALPDAAPRSLALDTASMALLSKALPAAPAVPVEGMRTALPDVVTDAKAACGGAFLVLRFKDYPKLGIFDVLGGKFSGFIPAADQKSLFAVGGTRLVTVNPGTRKFEVWSLPDGKLINSTLLDAPGNICVLEMGLLNERIALLGSENLERNTVYFSLVQLPGGEITVPAGPVFALKNPGEIGVAINPEGDDFVVWNKGFEISGAMRASIKDGKWAPGSVSGAGQFTADGRLRLRDGNVFLAGGEKVEGLVAATSLSPIYGAKAYLHVDGDGQITVRSSTTHLVLARIVTPPNALPSARRSDGVFDVVSGYTGRLVEIADRELITFKLPPFSEVDDPQPSLLSPAVAVPGARYERELALPQPEFVVVEDAPPGVSWDSGARRLRWDVPSDQPSGIAEILLSYRKPDGKTDYEIVKVTVP